MHTQHIFKHPPSPTLQPTLSGLTLTCKFQTHPSQAAMAPAGASSFPVAFPPVVLGSVTSTSSSSSSSNNKLKVNPVRSRTRRFAVSTEQIPSQTMRTIETTTSFVERKEVEETVNVGQEKRMNPYAVAVAVDGGEVEVGNKGLKDFFEESRDFIKSDGCGGPPRWFSPLECGFRLQKSPLLLFLPGIDGVGLGLIRQHLNLGKIFDIWCLHIPVKDRTSFTDLVKLVEGTVRSENHRSPNKPIYLVGESLGACLALAVAARNPDVDLVLVLANPATSFERSSQLQLLVPLLDLIPDQLHRSLPNVLSSITGNVVDNLVKGLPLQQILRAGGLSEDALALPSYLSVMADILPSETLVWKLKMIKSASAFSNSRLHAVKAQTLILSSGKDQLLPSQEEGQRLSRALPKCEIREFSNSGHFLFLEDGIDLGTTIKGAAFYRRGRYHDYVSDFVPPTPVEFKRVYESSRWILQMTSPVMLSTLEDGTIVRGLAGIPSEGPVLLVGYHMLLGLELTPLVTQILLQRNILVRGIAHPMMFQKLKQGNMPPISQFDILRLMGAVPVSGSNFFKLFSSKAHVLLYPGGVREACHRKGEEYKLFWPEQSEFVRMAARFGAKIVPFGVVGEDDVTEILLDYNDQMRIPVLKKFIEDITSEVVALRTETSGEVGNQDLHLPLFVPKPPGRFYFFFGKPIETEGRKQALKDREKAHELYLQAKSGVENCLAYLQKKRESDPYRSIAARIAYQTAQGFDAEIPTFEL